ncbi:MAG TPA: hypothetical protein VGK96_10575 [Candidatus Sulfotelmatobacter sp.]|jgi:hypothetical protein
MNRSPPEDPIIAAALVVVDSPIDTFYSAKICLQDSNSLRTIGTLIDFEDQAANLAAAVRLFKMQRRPI